MKLFIEKNKTLHLYSIVKRQLAFLTLCDLLSKSDIFGKQNHCSWRLFSYQKEKVKYFVCEQLFHNCMISLNFSKIWIKLRLLQLCKNSPRICISSDAYFLGENSKYDAENKFGSSFVSTKQNLSNSTISLLKNLVLIPIKHYIKISRQGVFSFSVTCLVVHISTFKICS